MWYVHAIGVDGDTPSPETAERAEAEAQAILDRELVIDDDAARELINGRIENARLMVFSPEIRS